MKYLTIFIVFMLASAQAFVFPSKYEPRAPFAPIDAPYNGFSVRQCVTGTADLNVFNSEGVRIGGLDLPNPQLGLGAPVFASTGASFVFHNGDSAQFTLANGTYTTAPNPFTGAMECFYDPYYTFDHEVSSHKVLVKVGFSGNVDQYFGRASDVGSCETKTAFNIRVNRMTGVNREIQFSQGLPIPVQFPPQGLTATGTITYDSNCPISGPDFDSLFQLPYYCLLSNLPSWCLSKSFA